MQLTGLLRVTWGNPDTVVGGNNTQYPRQFAVFNHPGYRTGISCNHMNYNKIIVKISVDHHRAKRADCIGFRLR
ncbi:hypothetical protein PanABDRAFT_1523 [Pantoea sp. aB]|nr:hypothetical protein PanABDRAFT_1523 [Pantoea sp. aB]SJZ86642.1 hypothetical protein SAMN03097723_2298 [Pantoea eucalypti]